MSLAIAQGPDKHAGTALWARGLVRWLPALMLAYGLIIWPVLYGRSPDTGAVAQSQQGASSALSQIYFPVMFLVAGFAWIVTSYRRSPALRNPTILLIGLMGALFVLSVGWSVVPGTALRRVILQVTIVAALILSVVAADDPEGIVERIFWMLAGVMLANLATVALKPPGPLGHEGLFPQKNGLGAAAALAILFSLNRLFTGRPWTRVAACGVIAVAAVLLVLSKSKTSFGLSFIVPALALAICIAARATRISVALLVIGLFGLALLVYKLGVAAHVWDFPKVAGALFGDPTLTTRTEIWDFALSMAERRPVLGYGFESFWQAGPGSPAAREARGFIATMPHSHNGYIDLYIQTGLVGLSLMGVLLASAFHTAGSILPRHFGLGTLCVTLILFASLLNGLESAWFRGFDFFSMVFVTAVALAASARAQVP